MQKVIYYIGFFFILCSFALVEYIISPPLLYEGDKSLYEEKKSTLKQEVMRNPLKISSIDPILKKLGMEKIFHTTPVEINHLFHMIPLDADNDDFRVAQISYFRMNEIQEKEKMFIMYEIFSTKPRTILSAYTDLKNKTIKNFSQNPEIRVIETNNYGDKSFVIRLESNQKTMYLMVAYRDRLLGFEYPIGEKFSRHEKMGEIFIELFSQ